MQASVVSVSQFGRRALSTCVVCTPKSIFRRLNNRFLYDSLFHGKDLENSCASRKRGLSRLSAGYQQRTSKYPPPRRDVSDKPNQEQKQPIFGQEALRFYATCHPGMT